MKKRAIAFFSLLLALCLTLGSCAAAGIESPALFSTLSHSVKGIFANTRDLLAGNTRIIDGGTAGFTLICPASLPEEVREEVDALCAAVLERTGATLPVAESATGGACIQLELLHGDVALAVGVNDSTYRIYFDEHGSLHLAATNSIMLAEAVRYFSATFVCGENASADTGRLAIPTELDLLSATSPVFDGDTKPQYVVVRPENASDRIVAAAQRITDAIKGVTGASVKIKSDFRVGTQESEQIEILVGSCERPGVAERAAELDKVSFYMGTAEKSILLLGATEEMTERAVSKFIETFVEGKVSAAQKGQLLLPSSFSYTCTGAATVLASGGLTNYVLIYPAGASTALKETVTCFADRFYYLTGAVLPTFADAARPVAAAKEILVGSTNRTDTVPAYDAWGYSMVGSRLVVYGGSDLAISDALTALTDALTALVCAQNDLEGVGEALSDPYTARFLAVAPTLARTGLSAPALEPLTGKGETGEGSWMMYRTGASTADLEQYLTLIKGLGYTEYASRKVGEGGVRTDTYYNGSYVLSISLADCEGTLRVIADPAEETALPPQEAATAVCDPLVIQLGGIYTSADCGMSYVIRLTDGTFLVVDGGWTDGSIADGLYNTLKRNNPLKGEPVISCWIFTHGHLDHIGAFITFSGKYASKVSLRSVCYSFPSAEQTLVDGGVTVNWYLTHFRLYTSRFGSGVKVYKARTGQLYRFAGCELEMLFTFEDYAQPRRLSFFNDSSLVFRLTLTDRSGNTQRLMMLGDASEKTCGILVSRYGAYLQSDAVQVAHHGYSGGTDAVYNAIGAAVVFWPCPLDAPESYKNDRRRFSNPEWSPVTRRMLDQDYAKVLYVAGLGSVTLTVKEIKDRTMKGIGIEAVYHAAPPTTPESGKGSEEGAA